MLAGVFYPTFSAQIVNGVLAAAVFIVLVVWSVAYLAWMRPAALARQRATAAEKPLPKTLVAALDAGLPEPPAEESPPAAAAPETPPQPPKPESKGGPTHA